ncbi:MAG TPA: hypothetical protein IAA04_10825 [Candidatus Lachnoclostridium pullistercoris]|uniref:Uncharacterized protein n=1 Tax=Candidatus Lachnoclostridium pullistercoris TaxID=2838632 RepID=A0A9D2PFZ8_9FIRM|nr:hypothetical protein [Candidatus Lachnoclostridium pullistercoris]
MYDSKTLIALPNPVKTINNNAEKKVYNKTSSISSAVCILFAGAMMLKGPVREGFISDADYAEPSYIQCINLNQKRDLLNLESNRVIDLLKIENLRKIKNMSLFEENWNGTGGSAFSEKSIALFENIIEMLEIQPQIAPTGRNSLLMQYELDDKSLLAFEVSEDRTEKVYIPEGDYSMAQTDIFTKNVEQKIKESVEEFYGFK